MSIRFAERFTGKVALLTGSAAAEKGELMGFGGATVWRFLEEGGRGVVITDVQDEIGERSAQQLRDAGHDALYMHLDVTEEQDWSRVVDATMEHFGRLDILVNIAGILDPKSLLDIEPEVWKKTMEISTVGIFFGTRAVAKPMEQSGGGAIINLASMAASRLVRASPYLAVRSVTVLASTPIFFTASVNAFRVCLGAPASVKSVR